MGTLLYNPLDEKYFDPLDAHAERERTFSQCNDCRLCIKYCYSFKDLFKLADELDHDVSKLTDTDHEHVVSECFQCQLCYINCPYTPEKGQEWKIDFPALMLRSLALMKREGKIGRGANLLAQTDKLGKAGTRVAPLANAVNKISPLRKISEKVTGISADRLLPEFAKVRFSKWFRKRSPLVEAQSDVALFPSCLVEYQEPAIGKATVQVYEHNGIRCELPEGQVCCGMPWLDAGNTEKFTAHAQKNVETLLPSVREGKRVIVPQPTCAYVLRTEYPLFLGTPEAQEVADATRDSSEFLMDQHREKKLSTEFTGKIYESITWHAACHYRAQPIGAKSQQLMALTGAKVQMVDRCSAIDGTWGLRAENADQARTIAQPLMDTVRKQDAELVAGDCHLANTAIREGTDREPMHPMQVMARAYGLDEE